MQQKKLKVYFTSDVHGYFYPTTYGDMDVKPVGLFGCAADFNKDDETLIIDGGDILQGSAFAYYCRQVADSPEVIADIMNDCGYDYYTLGNHDFNYGLEYQAAYRSRNNGVCVCQNITDEAGNTLFPWKLHTMKNGLRVGIVGIVTDYVNIWEKEENLKGIHITDPFEAAKNALAQMKEQTDLTICIYHGGFECDLESGETLSQTTENVGYRICKELDFDILLTGHQHMSVPGRDISGTYTVQPCDNAKEYQYLEVTMTDHEKSIRSELRQSDAAKGTVLADKYRSTENAVQAWLNQPIGHLSRAIRVISSLSSVLRNSAEASLIALIPSSSMRSQASWTASSSNAHPTSSTSLKFFSVISATSAPFLGIIRTRPSSSSLRIASRIGVRLTPSLFASWISISLSPGFSSPLKIACRSVLNTTSRSGKYSFIVTSKLGSFMASSLHCEHWSHTPVLPDLCSLSCGHLP